MTTKHIALFFCAFSTTTCIFSQIVFEEQTSKAFDNVYRSTIVHSDIDGDGDLDLFVTGYSGNVAISKLYSNDGTGVLTELLNTPFPGVSAGSSAFKDIDGDGDEDLLVTGYTNSNQRIAKLYKNDGTGMFSEVQGTPFDGVSFSSVAFADVDNDNDQDVLITGYNDNNQRISKLYLNNGSGIFSLAAGTPFQGISFGSVAFADIDNDGDQDVLITGENTSEQPIAKLYLNNGSGSFTELTGLPFEGVSYSSIAFADIDNDGDKDVFITGKKSYSVDISKLYRNNGNGSFSVVASPTFQGIYSGAVAFADINGDNDQDLLFIGHTTTYAQPVAKLYSNNGSGVYTEVINPTLTGNRTGAIAFMDIDNDGDQDIVTSGMNSLNSAVSKLYRNDGNGIFTDTSTPFIEVSYSAVVFEDIDNDGDQDVLVTGTDNFNQGITTLYKNDGTGIFSQILNTPFIHVRRGKIAFADIDNDGDQDVFITGGDNTTNQAIARLYTNNGSGIFTEIPGTIFTPVIGDIAFADVDNDGDQDLFITGGNSNLPTSKLYLNDGTGNFTVSSATFAQVFYSSAAFADIDNDGDLDLILAGSQSTSTTSSITKLYRNNGSGMFTEVSGTLFEPMNTGDLAFADVDNDGDQDVLISGRSNSSQSVTRLYLNDGTGNYTADATNSFPGSYFTSIAFSDVDNDGDQDVLITGYTILNQPATKLYLNDGSGLFTLYSNVPFTHVSAGSGVFADIDNDGDQDVLITGDKQAKLYKNITCFSVDPSTTVSGNVITANEPGALYNWLDCNNNYLPVGVTTQSFSPSVNGNYAVEIMQPGGCVVRSSCVQISELGIQSPGTDDEFLLFPNPVDHLVTVKAPFPVDYYSVLDIQGRIVKEGPMNNDTIDLSDMESGSYLIHLKAEKQEVIKPIIKR